MASGETTHLPPGPQKFFLVTSGVQWPEGVEAGLTDIKKALNAYAEVERHTARPPATPRFVKGTGPTTVEARVRRPERD
ncbi:hypothetical protein [Lentzea sp. NBRC 102530]|uniref:hypothetical protein n=1 Tax=Lentzea sp. NBRC 102530 TaxID=3032201 RepID=UPI0024A08490|nr:hypothetical protein [Lentzea sp. NBRC 102530]GLY46800.1 hypothetical protein Lesp01_04560 [Lentzea sp. NBRC 102530]